MIASCLYGHAALLISSSFTPRFSSPPQAMSMEWSSHAWGIFPLAHETRGWPQYQRLKTSTKCYSLSTCFSHNSTHIHACQPSPAWTARIGFASPQLQGAFSTRVRYGPPLLGRRFYHTLSIRARLTEVQSSYHHVLAVLTSPQR